MILITRNNKLKIIISVFVSILAICLCVVIYVINNKPANALSKADWRAGNIIDDGEFYNNNSMSEAEIQRWLDSQINCDVNGSQTSEWGGGNDYNGDGRVTRAEWARSVYGHTGKFICLNNYYENPTTRASNLNSNVIPSGAISSAAIIKRAADSYGVNPKVLLVKLRKESPGPLTSDTWPLPSQFDAALGYACPDPPAGQPVVCDPNFSGFYRQITQGAKQIKNYKTYSSSYRYKPFQNNSIQYNPNVGCGATSVYLSNYATAGLYNYTPYQPNAAALNNLYGTGDGCSAYGNRNFWTMYHNMFGVSAASAAYLASESYIPDGTYVLQNIASGRSLDLTNGQTSNGTRVQIWDSNGTGAQKWEFKRQSDGFYSVRNPVSGKFLDVANASSKAGAAVQIWTGNGSCAQRWKPVFEKNKYVLANKCSGYILDLTGGRTSRGSKVQIWDSNGTGAQKWEFRATNKNSIASGVYTVVTPTNKALEIAGGQTANGTMTQIWDSNGTGAQKWEFKRQSDNLYSIRNLASNSYLDVKNADTKAGAKVHIMPSTGSCAQRWEVLRNSDGSHKIKSSCTHGLSLDIAGGLIGQNGVATQMYTSNTSGAQKWTLTSTPPLEDGTYSLSTPSNKSLDLTNGQTSNGTRVQIWDSNGTGAQKWEFKRQSDGFYSVRNPVSGKFLDVANASSKAGAAVQLMQNTSSCAQLWELTRNSDSTLSISTACTDGLSLDVAGGKVGVRGASVQIFTSNTSGAQRWLPIP